MGPNQANATYNVNNKDHLTYMKAPKNKIENVLEEQIVNVINELPSKQSSVTD